MAERHPGRDRSAPPRPILWPVPDPNWPSCDSCWWLDPTARERDTPSGKQVLCDDCMAAGFDPRCDSCGDVLRHDGKCAADEEVPRG